MQLSRYEPSGPQLVLDELNHRFLNSLQVIATLAAVTPAGEAAEPGVGRQLRRLRECISALSRLHRLLATPAAPPFEDACGEIRHALVEAFERPMAMTLRVDEEPADPSLSRGLLLLVTELMTNAIKHARTETLAVTISLGPVGGGWRLRVVSDTPGAPATPRIAAALADWLGGELWVECSQQFEVQAVFRERACGPPLELCA